MLVELLVIVALLLLNGVFAAAEIAVIAVRSSRIATLVDSGSARARALEGLRRDPERFLATVQIGVTVVSVVASAFGGATLAERLSAVLRAVPALALHAEPIALTAIVVVISYLSLVIGELIPKSLALRYAERYALAIARPLRGLSWFARPLVRLLTASSNVVLRLFGDRTTFMESRLSPEEIQTLVEDAAEAGSVDPSAGQIASRAIDLAGLTVSKIMIPRNKVVALPRTATMEDIRDIVAAKGHTRMPVFDGDLDHIEGYLNVKDLVARPAPADGALTRVLRPAYFVGETMPAVRLLEEMKRRRAQFAVVIDELGVTSGIVTLEDLVEEIVGDVASELESVAPPSVRAEPDGSFLVRGEAAVHDINRELDLSLPEGDSWSTIAGLCLDLAGKIPTTGERLQTKDGLVIEIVDASDRQIRSVRVRCPEREGPPVDEAWRR